jgi:hypothetical protein
LISSASVPVRTIGLHQLGLRAAIVLGVALATASTPALAEIQVSGTPQAVRIDARDAPLEEILAALNHAFGVHYQLSVNLDKQLSGTYEGSLKQVLTGILRGYNFVLYTDSGVTTVTVAGTANAPGSPGRPASSSAQVVGQPSSAAPSAQAPVSSSRAPVSSSGVKDVAPKGLLSVLESAAGQSRASAPEAPFEPRPSTAALRARQAFQPNPEMAALHPSPPRPFTAVAPQLRPAPQPMPSTAAHQPRPSTAAPQPRPSAAALQPRQALQPNPPTAALQLKPVPQPRSSRAVPQPRPSTVAPPGQ